MKIALRLFCLASLLCAGWAVVGADDRTAAKSAASPAADSAAGRLTTFRTTTATVAQALPAAANARPTATLSPPTMTVVPPTAAGPAPAAATLTFAQPAPTNVATPADIRLSHGTLTPTPEMWFYEQMRQDYNNPELQARRRAEDYAAQRRARIAARQWYGYSNSRPSAHITPFTYYYSPAWSSNTVNPFLWSGRNPATVVVEARRSTVGISGFGTW